MKTLLKKLMPIVLLLVVGLAMAHPLTASAQNGIINGGTDFTTGGGESTGLTNTLFSVTHYIMYVFYLLGIIFMGVAAIKFKNGDMEAMGKNLGGSVCLFLVPKLVEVIIGWAAR